MALLPYLDAKKELIDGAYFHLLPFCIKNYKKEKCKAHYNKIMNSDSGCYCCPYGLSSYVYTAPTGKIIFTGLRIKGVYDKKKSKVTEK
jgi:hypothetical protein